MEEAECAFVLSFTSASPLLSSVSHPHLDHEFMFYISCDVLMCERRIKSPNYKSNLLSIKGYSPLSF